MSDLTLFAGNIPANYDKFLGPYLFEPYALDLKDWLKNDECNKVLEIACGTGRVTNHLIEIIGENGKILATDLNSDMIAIAKTRVTDKRVEWQIADAQKLPYHDEAFDHVICQFGVMFFPDKLKAFKEAQRVLNKKGKFVFNTWGSLKDNNKTGVIKDVLENIFEDEAPDFLQKGPYSFYDSNIIKALLRDAGFTDISIEPVVKVAEYADVQHYINGFIDGTPLSAFLQKKDPSARNDVKQKLKQALSKEAAENLESEMLAFVCIGVKE
jgi:ubiquinone/menaquinone biosynthesis C-methylase UbiE